MTEIRNIYELTTEEFAELREYMLFDDENEFYDSIEDIDDSDVIRRFGSMTFRKEDFSCNRKPTPINGDEVPFAS